MTSKFLPGILLPVLLFFIFEKVNTLSLSSQPEPEPEPAAALPEKSASGKVEEHFLTGNRLTEKRQTGDFCAIAGEPCKETCDCCQRGVDSYFCTAGICTSTIPSPLICPAVPCQPPTGPCVVDCDCCQFDDETGEPVAAYCDKFPNEPVGTCSRVPGLIIDCFPPPPPTQMAGNVTGVA